MKTRSIVNGVAQAVALAFFVASAALAQPAAPKAGASTVAHLEGIEGNVLVSQPSGLAAGRNGLALQEGIRVFTTANSRGTVKFENGCSVRLEPNQRLVIQSKKSCEALALLVESTLPEPAIVTASPAAGGLGAAAPASTGLADAALGGSLQNSITGLASGVVGVAFIVESRRGGSVSPN